MIFLSNIDQKYKSAASYTLINRDFKLSSNYTLFHNELTFLSNYSQIKGISLCYFNSTAKKFLNQQYRKKPLIPTVLKQTFYAQLPFIGTDGAQMPKALLDIIGKFYPQIDPKFSFRHNFTIGSFFKRHTPSDMLVRSSLIYKYTCDCCQQSHISSTFLQLFRRCAQHKEVSFRTGTFLTRSDNSAIRDHCFSLDHPF